MKVFVVTVCLLSFAYIQVCDAQATCYQCGYNMNAGMDKECMDPFMLVTPMIREDACNHGCSKAVTTVDGEVKDVTRGCADEGCMAEDCTEMGDGTKCTYCCNSNNCNIAMPLVVNMGLITGTVFVSIIINMVY